MAYIYVTVDKQQYPYTLREYKRENPNVSVPQEPTEAQLQELGIYLVVDTPRPADELGKVVEEKTPVLINGIWTQKWEVRDATPAEVSEQQRVLTNSIVADTQKRLDDFARTRGYDDVNSASKYKDISDADIASLPKAEQSLVAKFKVESQYLALMTARTWASLYLILDEVQTGVGPVPSGFADIEALLPQLRWPI